MQFIGLKAKGQSNKSSELFVPDFSGHSKCIFNNSHDFNVSFVWCRKSDDGEETSCVLK